MKPLSHLKPSWQWFTYNRVFWICVGVSFAVAVGLATIPLNSATPGKASKHAISTLAAFLALVASVLQAAKAEHKAQHDRTSEFDADHFHFVSKAWCIVSLGALLGFAAEIIDFRVD